MAVPHAAGDAAVKTDEALDGLGAAVVGLARVEVGQEWARAGGAGSCPGGRSRGRGTTRTTRRSSRRGRVEVSGQVQLVR